MANLRTKAKWIIPPPVGAAVGWATGASAGAPPPVAWTLAGIIGWLSEPFNWSFIIIGVLSGLAALVGLHKFIHPAPQAGANEDIIAEIQKLRLDLLAQNKGNAQQIEGFVATATDLAGSDDAQDRAIARQAVEDDPLGASARLLEEVDKDVANAAERARQAARIAAPFSVKAALSAYARAVELDPDHFTTWIELARLHQSAGSLPQARRAAEAGLQRANYDRERSVAETELGGIAMAEGNLPSATAHYQSAISIDERLAAQDAGNSTWQRDLSVSHIKLGNVAVAAGDLATARARYDASLAIFERLAAQDAGNSAWQRDLSVSHIKLGDVAVAAGDLAAARVSYSASLAIRVRLAAQDAGNSEWQRDLSVSHNRLGDVAVVAGDLAAARASYAAGLAIRERLAAQDAGNSEWQRDLFVSHAKLARLAEAGGDAAGAIREFAAGEAILVALLARVVDHPGFARDLAQVRRDLARLRGK